MRSKLCVKFAEQIADGGANKLNLRSKQHCIRSLYPTISFTDCNMMSIDITISD